MTGKVVFILVAACLGIPAAVATLGADAAKPKTLRICLVGNRVTDTVKYRLMAAFFLA